MMKLKTAFPLLVAMLTLLTLDSCFFTKGKLESIVEHLDKECPQEIDAGMTVTSVTLNGDEVTFSCRVDEQAYQNVCASVAEPSFVKLYKREVIPALDKALLQEIIAKKAGVKFVYETSYGDRKELKISAAEISEAKKNPAVGDDRLDVLLQIMRKRLPIEADPGMKVTEVTKHSRTLFLTTDITQSGLTREQVKENISKQSAVTMFTKEGIESDPLTMEAVKRGYDVEFVYKSDKFAGTEKLHFTNYSLKKVLGNY